MFGKNGGDSRRVRRTVPSHDGSKLLKELVRAAGRKRDHALTWLVADIQERVADAHRDMHEAAGLAAEHVVAKLHFVGALQEIDGFMLPVVDVQRRAAV